MNKKLNNFIYTKGVVEDASCISPKIKEKIQNESLQSSHEIQQDIKIVLKYVIRLLVGLTCIIIIFFVGIIIKYIIYHDNHEELILGVLLAIKSFIAGLATGICANKVSTKL